uniref:Genome polyprotein n=1 Tax=Minnesota murine picornavirus 1 TaxID=3239331 RepID=A0AB39J7Z1_9VIRU
MPFFMSSSSSPSLAHAHLPPVPSLPHNVWYEDAMEEFLSLNFLGRNLALHPKPLVRAFLRKAFSPRPQGAAASKAAAALLGPCASLPTKAWVVWNPQDVLAGYQIRYRCPHGDLYQLGWVPAPGNRFQFAFRPITGDALSSLPLDYFHHLVLYAGRTFHARWDILNPPFANFHLVQRQGNSTTNIYGNGNNVTTDVGANGWSPDVGIGEAPVVSRTSAPSKGAGSSGTSSSPSGKNSSGSRYSKWWEPAAARGLEHGIDRALGVADRAIDTTADALNAGLGKVRSKFSSQDTRLMAMPPNMVGNILATDPTSTQHGNTEIQTQGPYSVTIAYPPEPYPVLPNPDAPSCPGPSGDRAWLVDSFPWSEEYWQGLWLWDKNAWNLNDHSYPPQKMGPNSSASGSTGSYPFPWALTWSNPDCVWTSMYQQHAYWRAGCRWQLTVNGSQFHAGALVLFAAPEVPDPHTQENANFIYPYAILNLATGNTCTLELPYISPTPLTSTSLFHATWNIFIFVLTPLSSPTGTPTTLYCNLYCTPTNTEFYGLRYPLKQHLKTRHVPGSGAFGTAVSGQEMPLVGIHSERPPDSYLPGHPRSWLEFASRPGLAATLNWTMADDIGTKLLLLPVSPDSLASLSTPLGFVLTLYSQWQGEIKAQLLFTGSAQHYGRLVVAYTPPATTPPTTMDEAMHGTYTVWDINGTSTLDFTIPFMSQSYWKTVDIGTPEGLLNTNGYVSIWVMNPLTGPSAAPPSATICGFLLAGDSFRVRLQQAPALGWGEQAGPDSGNGGEEAGVETSSSVTTMESGVPDTALKPRTTFDYTDTDVVKDSLLNVFFSFYRLFPLTQLANPLLVDAGKPVMISTDPVTMFPSNIETYLSCFTYFTADLRMNFRLSSSAAITGALIIAFLPIGCTIPTTITESALSNYTLVEQPFNGLGTKEISVSFPYTSPQSALMTKYCGWPSTGGGDFGILHTNAWGTIVLYLVSPDPSNSVQVQAWISLGNFKGYCPRAVPTLGPMPQTAMLRVAGPPTAAYVERRVQPPPSYALARRQAFGIDRSHGWGDLFLEDEVWVVKVQRPTYIHWALRRIRWDGCVEQISLQNEGCKAVVGYEEPEGELYEEVELDCWDRATRTIGCEYPYSATTNCSTFVSYITSVPCENTGLALGYGLAGLSALTLAAVGVKTLKAQRQGLGDISKAAAGVNQQTIDSALREFATGVRVVDQSSVRIEAASRNILQAAGHVDFSHLENSAETIAAAAERMASSIDGARETVERLSESIPASADSAILSFLKWIAKIFGYLLVLFGSPTPMSISGLLVLICADLSTHASGFFTNCKDVLGALWCWIASKLGLSVSPEDAQQAAAAASAEKQCAGGSSGVRDYNNLVTAAKNTEWLLDKVLYLLDKLLTWLGLRVKDDPQGRLAQMHETIIKLYSDSLSVLHKVEMGDKHFSPLAVKNNLQTAEQALSIAADAKSSMHASLCTQAIKNYTTALNAIDKGRSGNTGARPEPLVVYLYGKPGCGKSVVASLLASVLAKKLGKDADDYYSPSSADCQYYDGYHQQPVHLIDDIGQDPEGRDWADFVNLVSTAPFIVPMANLEDKGMYYRSQVIICTSNFQGPNDRSARSIQAIDRRLHIRIHVSSDGFRVDDALTPCGPESKHFAAECPLTRLEALNLKFDQRSLFCTNLDSLDDLVDLILDQITVRASNSSRFRSLIKQAGDFDPSPPTCSSSCPDLRDKPHCFSDCSPECKHPPGPCSCPPPSPFEEVDRVFESISGSFDRFQAPPPPPVVFDSTAETPEEMVRKNQPFDLVEAFWKYRKPIFACTTFITVLGFVATVISLAVYYRKAGRQAAYSGMPGKAPPKPPRKPAKIMTSGAIRQSLSPAVPKLALNVHPLSSYKNGHRLNTVSVLFVHGRIGVTVSHLFEDADSLMFDGVMYPISGLNIVYDGELAALELPVREHRSIVRFLRPDCNYGEGFLISSILSGTSYVKFWDAQRAQIRIEDVMDEPDALIYHCPSFPGLCGAPVVALDPSGVSIRGIHVAGIPNYNGMACVFSKERWERLHAALAAQRQSLLQPCEPVGPPSHIPRKSALKRSPAYGAFPVTKEPAPLSKLDPRLSPEVCFDVQVFTKHGRGDTTEAWPGLAEAFDLYFSDFPSSLPTLTMEEAINGTPDLDGIDMGQSPGYPWVERGRSRRSLFTWEGDHWEPLPELKSEILACLENPIYTYTTSLKDELRPLEKVKAGGTRLIEAAPIHAIIAGRMLLGGLFAYMQARPGAHGSAVGCNPDRDWTKFFWQFSCFDQVYGLDYKAFDSTLPSICFDLVSQHLTQRIGDPRVARYISSISTSTHVFGNQFYRMVGGNPSGCVGTSILNTIINNCCLLSALMAQPEFSPSKFKILCYGDDVVYATEPPIHPSKIKEFYDEHTPLKVTPADKSETFPDQSTIYDVTFLKRYFVPDDKRVMYIHPVIDPETYRQSVMWTRKGDFQDVVTSLCYLAFHAGPQNYQNWCNVVLEKCRQSGCEPKFLPYSFLQYSWLKLVSA